MTTFNGVSYIQSHLALSPCIKRQLERKVTVQNSPPAEKFPHPWFPKHNSTHTAAGAAPLWRSSGRRCTAQPREAQEVPRKHRINNGSSPFCCRRTSLCIKQRRQVGSGVGMFLGSPSKWRGERQTELTPQPLLAPSKSCWKQREIKRQSTPSFLAVVYRKDRCGLPHTNRGLWPTVPTSWQ